MDVKNREMKNLKVFFDVLEGGAKILVGHNKSSSRLVFDTRMTLEHKAIWVTDRHRTPDLEWSTFIRVVSRDSTRVSLNNAALKDLPMCACDIQNTHLQSPSS